METTAKKKILIVDDDKAMANAMARIFSGHDGYAVEVSYSGSDAGQKIGVNKPDLVVVDMCMPGVDGYKLITDIRNDPATKAIKILVISAVFTERDAKNIKEFGADDFLPKPFDNDQFRNKAQELLA